MTIAFRSVSKTFFSLRGPVPAVRDVCLDVAEGELFVLLGPSGCGKSTILNLAAGLERPTAGEIRIGGGLVAAAPRGVFVPPQERNVAMVFQSYALYPHMTVFDNIAFPLRIAREKREAVRRAVEEAAAMLGIGELLHARPGELSGGQRQRVAIARAVVRRPRLFLLDEPLSNLDASLRAATRAELKRLQRRLGVTTLYVTHDQVEAMTLGDRIALLRDGRVVQVGTPEDLYERPASPFAAAFVGTTPMNLVKTDAGEEDGGWFVRLGRMKVPLPPEQARQVRELGPGEVLVGIRPEHVRAARASPDDPRAGTVATVENLGPERLLRVEIGGHVLSVLTDDRTVGEGDAVVPVVDMRAARFFREDDRY
jgi:multiple sugar transport system ATP-binding protein